MAKIEFTLDCSKIMGTIRKAQADVFVLMFDSFDTDLDTMLSLMGISVQEDEN